MGNVDANRHVEQKYEEVCATAAAPDDAAAGPNNNNNIIPVCLEPNIIIIILLSKPHLLHVIHARLNRQFRNTALVRIQPDG